jgi:LuxR family transcriptional regulator, maltose regulon positive regulatory protein
MPKSAQYIVSWSLEQENYLLTEPENGGNSSPLEDEDGWLMWIERHRAFAFHGRNGHLNLLKEKRSRGGEGYWYAYQRCDGRMVKRYVGRGEQLSLGRLEEMAASLPLGGAEKAVGGSLASIQQPESAGPTPRSLQFDANLHSVVPISDEPYRSGELAPSMQRERLDRGNKLKGVR